MSVYVGDRVVREAVKPSSRPVKGHIWRGWPPVNDILQFYFVYPENPRKPGTLKRIAIVFGGRVSWFSTLNRQNRDSIAANAPIKRLIRATTRSHA